MPNQKNIEGKATDATTVGGTIQAFVVMAFLLSLSHAGLIAQGKVLGTKRFLLGRMWRWHTLLCGPNIAWAARPLWVTGDTQDTMSRSVLRALGGSVWEHCCFSKSSSSDQGHIYTLSSKLTFMCETSRVIRYLRFKNRIRFPCRDVGSDIIP